MDAAYDIPLAARGSKPMHVAIAEHLAAAIRAGRLGVGERLLPERELSGRLGVSRMTVRQALGELEHDGLVRRVVGRAGGTFVSEPAAGGGSAEIDGLSATLRRGGAASGVELVSVDVEPVRRRTADALALKKSDRVVVIVRMRLAGGKPLAIERTSLPVRLFPDIEDLDLGGSLHDLMDDGFGLRPVRAVERLEIVEARSADARALGVRRDAPLFFVERIGYAADGRAVELARDRFRCDRTSIVVESTGTGE